MIFSVEAKIGCEFLIIDGIPNFVVIMEIIKPRN